MPDSELQIRVRRQSRNGQWVARPVGVDGVECAGDSIDEAVDAVRHEVGMTVSAPLLLRLPALPEDASFPRRVAHTVLWLMNWRKKRFWFIALLFGPVGYVLSVGPFIWLYYSGLISEPVAELLMATAYMPLIFVYENLPAFESFLDLYLEFWEPTSG